MVCLWICAASAEYGIAGTFCQTHRNSARIAALYKTAHFQEVQRTRRDKRGARYATLISAAEAGGGRSLLHSTVDNTCSIHCALHAHTCLMSNELQRLSSK